MKNIHHQIVRGTLKARARAARAIVTERGVFCFTFFSVHDMRNSLEQLLGKILDILFFPMQGII